uniref:Homeobox domain-containing protein n=1 Tax=Capra hircus TaxID=9925 RepID=A0A452FC04_CAPHI
WWTSSRACGLRSYVDSWVQLLCKVWGLSSPIRVQTHVLCIARQILNHWTNGQLPWKYFLAKIFIYSLLTEKRNSARRFRTRFNGEQLGALRDVFERTRYPHWFLIRTLASTTHLDESVIKTWFKNQRVKRRREENQTQQNLSPGDPCQVVSVEEEEMSLPGTSGSTHPTSLSLADDSHHELPELSCAQQCEGAAATPCPSSCNFLTVHLHQISLGDSDPPWASSPYDMDQLIQLYDLPGDDDPSSLDQYLFPECSSWGTVAGTDHHRDGEHSFNPEKVP